ncbi:MAG: zf-HC2 domain-containing protein [Anaerolineae bacterium]
MNCEQFSQLMGDYLEGYLNQRDRSLLEEHLLHCSRCTAELRRQPALERRIRRALSKSVQPLSLPADVSAQIVGAAEDNLQRARRSGRAIWGLRLMATAIALSLLLAGLLFLAGEMPDSSPVGPVALAPENQVVLSELDPVRLSPEEQADARVEPASSLPQATLFFEPRDMHPSQPFTMTVFLHNNRTQSLRSVRLDLDVDGPTGYYRFGLTVKGPLPAEGISILRLTPDLLAATCQEQYLIEPTDVFSMAGTYSVRLTLSDAVDSPH